MPYPNPYMPYQPSYTPQYQQPYGQPYQQPQQQPIYGANRVNGDDGANAFPMRPNTIAALFDDNDDFMYWKTADSGGFSTTRKFKLIEVNQDDSQQPQQFVSLDAFNALCDEVRSLREEIEDAKQPVRKHSEGHQPADA